MNTTSEKIRKWIENGRDPRSAHWQAALEALLEVFTPYLEPGRLTPVAPLAEDDIPGYQEALEVVDISPNLLAAFLPPSVAGKITPPESAPELRRIDGQKPSCKILIRRPGKEERTACAEISEAAATPGVDLFQDGALLGTYNYENRADCLASLNQIISAHLWEKGRWNHDEYKRYTVTWFEKVIDLNKTVSVRKNYSFLHTPSLIRINRVDAIFTLIYETFLKRAGDFSNRFDAAAKTAVHTYAEEILMQFLTVIKNFDLVDFKTFSKKENEQFSREYEWMVKKIAGRLAPDE
jgi:hypothetical protein